jgi:hypothetical protein
MAFEELKICKLLNLTALDWSAPLLSANFGDGYGAGVLSGSAAGLHKWSLSSELIPDWERHSIDYVLNDEPNTDTRFEYLFSFIKRHISLGNRPFRIKDPRSGKFYLASFQVSDGANFSFEVLAYKFFRGGIVLNQRRARNVLFNADGSLFAAPDNFRVSPLSSTSVFFEWDEAINDNQAGYDLWFDGGIYQLGNVTEYPFGSLVTGSTHTAKIRSRNTDSPTPKVSDWSDAITFVVRDVGGTTPVIITPPPPTSGVVDDAANTFGFVLAAGYTLADHEYSVNSGSSWSQVTVNPIVVGNVNYPVGQVRVRVKAATGRNASAQLSNTSAFTVAGNATPAAPTVISDDTADTISATPGSGLPMSEMLFSTNSGTFVPYDGSVIEVGNFNRSPGFYKFKTKAATGRNESPVALSPAFTSTVPTTETTYFLRSESGKILINEETGKALVTKY